MYVVCSNRQVFHLSLSAKPAMHYHRIPKTWRVRHGGIVSAPPAADTLPFSAVKEAIGDVSRLRTLIQAPSLSFPMVNFSEWWSWVCGSSQPFPRRESKGGVWGGVLCQARLGCAALKEGAWGWFAEDRRLECMVRVQKRMNDPFFLSFLYYRSSIFFSWVVNEIGLRLDRLFLIYLFFVIERFSCAVYIFISFF